MASTGDLDPTQVYDGYKAVEVLDPACTDCLAKGKDCFEHYNHRSQNSTTASLGRSHATILRSRLQTSGGICGVRRMGLLEKSSQFLRPLLLMVLQGILLRDVARWTNVGGPIPVGGRPIYLGSEAPISRMITEGIVKQIRHIANSPPNPDGEEAEVVPNSSGHPSNTSPFQPPSKMFQRQIIPCTPRNFQPTLATIPTSSPHSFHTRPALNPAVRPSPIQQPRNSPIVTSKQLQPVASTSRRRE
ncbi:hypothetical protein O181_061411 [Austropuccinia psidii MF-1]|uniref:Uncharacterized protein n=1 Tax=Austropuccinia psidii MF-1 TaxID=1389203 RepID=A0A9Q3HXH2_9BASI|nr:hypothetical protein [Austropuccinia psidii MF-1]